MRGGGEWGGVFFGWGGGGGGASWRPGARPFVLAGGAGPDEAGRWLWRAGGRTGTLIAFELWDFESWQALAARQVQFARGTGALVQLQFALNSLAWTHLLAGELTTAAQLFEEDRLISEVTGNPAVAYKGMMLAAWRGQEAEASNLIDAILDEAAAGGLGVNRATYARSVLNNGPGRHQGARGT